jgi:FtsH-binding integral membrane protein
MNQFEMTPSSAFQTSTVASAERVTAFLRAVYGWMCVGLGITAAVAWGLTQSPQAMAAIAANPILRWGTILAPLGLVFFLAARVEKMAPNTAAIVFAIYSALNGVMFSFVLLAYTGTSVVSTFVVTAGMFGALALFGTTTKRSLAGMGQFAMMGLLGLILASVVGLFWHSNGLQFGISIVGVIVFTLLTAWDAQRLKVMAAAVPEGRFGSYAVVGALSLYLDFINLFLFLLRFMGGGRRD